ncbi:uncharacterized protein M6B38_265115 [Iris pallida]|uniref:IST1-like protein n=1 Tax=Iris pallida TaxID=29817 RepID=A0AAX6ICC9_IRIPA|nr:uncharacterized protein M6B38_265115 [Iris pallida]
MFGNLLGGGKFSTKCKHAFKCIKSRTVLIKRKKQAMLKYLKKDVADLLSNGHDTNAFGRIDSLIVEINHAFCYDMIERYCECILLELPSLQKQRECPEEAMEAMSTLIFAAARFPDLPELCDLRSVFTERYGSQMESSKNREFVERVQKKSFSTEKKLQLMQYIAEEFSVPWDSKSFQQKLSNRSAAPASSDQPKRPNAAAMGRKEPIMNAIGEQEVPFVERVGSLVHKEQTQPVPRDIHVVPAEKNRKKVHAAAAEGPENVEPCYTDAKVLPPIKPKGTQNGSYRDGSFDEGAVKKSPTTTQEVPGIVGLENAKVLPSTEEATLIHRTPPYTKPNFKKPPTAADGIKHASVPADNDTSSGIVDRRPKPFSVRRKHPQPPVVAENENLVTSISPRKEGMKNDYSNGGEMPMDRQPRRDFNHEEASMKQHPIPAAAEELAGAVSPDRHASRRDQRKHGSRLRPSTYDGDYDEEEEAMDRLLIHYSKKGTSSNDASKTSTSTLAPPPELAAGADRAGGEQNRCHVDNGNGLARKRLDRISSLPSEPSTPAQDVGADKSFARTASMKLDMLSPRGGIVHPRLPDYDELAAKFIALRKA